MRTAGARAKRPARTAAKGELGPSDKSRGAWRPGWWAPLKGPTEPPFLPPPPPPFPDTLGVVRSRPRREPVIPRASPRIGRPRPGRLRHHPSPARPRAARYDGPAVAAADVSPLLPARPPARPPAHFCLDNVGIIIIIIIIIIIRLPRPHLPSSD